MRKREKVFARCTICKEKHEVNDLYYPEGCCEDCYPEVKEEKERLRKENAREGVVEVRYGIHEVENDGGHGYAYFSEEKLNLGDIVLVPETPVHDKPQQATVVSTYSDYEGFVVTILEVVKRKGGR